MTRKFLSVLDRDAEQIAVRVVAELERNSAGEIEVTIGSVVRIDDPIKMQVALVNAEHEILRAEALERARL